MFCGQNSILMIKTVSMLAFGCPDPDPHDYEYVERNGDQAVIRCHGSRDISREIKCHDGEWKGEFGNCSIGRWLMHLKTMIDTKL